MFWNCRLYLFSIRQSLDDRFAENCNLFVSASSFRQIVIGGRCVHNGLWDVGKMQSGICAELPDIGGLERWRVMAVEIIG